MKIKRSLSMVLAAALALCCVSLNAFAADRDEIQTLDLSDVKIVESTDWAEPGALPRSGLGGAFIELSDAKIVDSADWATLLDKDAPTALSDDEIMPLSRGDLAPKTVYVDKAISLTEGEVITVYGRWSPSNASVSVGIWDHANNAGLLQPVSNGYGWASFKITKSGQFSVAIANMSDVSINWNTSYVIA